MIYKNKTVFSAIIILLIAFTLFYKPLLSNQPLGLDTLGHLSKVSYLKAFPSADWDMSWYSGTLFLKLYSPMFYYLVAIFPNEFFAINLLSFLSLFLTSLGIYLIVKYNTKDEKVSLFSGVSYLSVLSISYYWISTGNLPYFFALWTIPFSLYSLEISLAEKKKRYFVVYSLMFALAILTHVIVGFLIGLLMILRIFIDGINIKNLKRMLIYGAIPILLASFWFLPFLAFSRSPGGYFGIIPIPTQLFGFFDIVIWGLYAGGVGILAYLLVLSFFLIKNRKKDNFLRFYSLSLVALTILLFGGLLNHYPYGVDPIRFILPFSIITALFVGMVIHKRDLFKNKYFLFGLYLMLFVGLFWNHRIIDLNFNNYSYCDYGSRYQIIQRAINDPKFPLKDEFQNYRFGTHKYLFGETLNYFMPSVPQTFGYQDAGNLNLKIYQDMRQGIWFSHDINDSIYWLDWFGVQYFEVENEDSSNHKNYMDKFKKYARLKSLLDFLGIYYSDPEDKDFIYKFKADPRFKSLINDSSKYDFTLFEYLEPKQIFSLVDYINDSSFGREKKFHWKRDTPDEAIIEYDSIDNDDVVLFKEFFHTGWAAREIPSQKKLNIKKVGPGFMAVYPSEESKGIVFYQRRSIAEYIGIFLSLSGIVLIIIMLLKKSSPIRRT